MVNMRRLGNHVTAVATAPNRGYDTGVDRFQGRRSRPDTPRGLRLRGAVSGRFLQSQFVSRRCSRQSNHSGGGGPAAVLRRHRPGGDQHQGRGGRRPRPAALLADAFRPKPRKGPEDAARADGRGRAEAIRKAGLEPSAVARVGLGSPGTMDIPAGKLDRAGEPQGLGRLSPPRPRGRALRPAGHLRQRRQRRRLRRVLGRLRPRFPQHGAVHPGHRHRLRDHHRRPARSTASTATAASAATSSSTVATTPGCAAAASAATSRPTPAPPP